MNKDNDDSCILDGEELDALDLALGYFSGKFTEKGKFLRKISVKINKLNDRAKKQTKEQDYE